MTARVIGLGGVQMSHRHLIGTSVRLDDGREGWVHGLELERAATTDNPASPEIVTRIKHYHVRLTAGRGTVAVPPRKLQALTRPPRAPDTFNKPKGAA